MMPIALVDGIHFFASCEQVFDVKLAHRPVVLSNNDGNIIARSKEAKALGIKMGESVSKLYPILVEHDVEVLSSNYEL